MTKHKTPKQRVDEILAAAAAEIDEKGYSGLTMEAIARRAKLSKGAVYRFFANKGEVALALFARCYKDSLNVDVDEAVDWNLPIGETFFRIILRFRNPAEDNLRNDRIWILLLPEVLRDSRFKAEREGLLAQITEKLLFLAHRLAARDKLQIEPYFEDKVARGIELGVTLFEGFTIQGSLGSSDFELERMARHLIDVLVRDVLGRDADGEGARGTDESK